MVPAGRERSRERLGASAGVAALHLLLAWALVAGFTVRLAVPSGTELKLFDVVEPPPPPEETPLPASRAADTPGGAAAPPNLEARPTPVVSPPRRLPVETPLPAAPPAPLREGSDTSAGNSDIAGPGTGAGGEGTGSGSGGRGDGAGSGGGIRAQRIGGRISGASDYPPAARRAGFEGTVRVRFVVGTDGRVGGCRVVRPSGNSEIDATTCRLIEQRFRYRPARDAQGRPVPETVSRTFDWLLPGRG